MGGRTWKYWASSGPVFESIGALFPYEETCALLSRSAESLACHQRLAILGTVAESSTRKRLTIWLLRKFPTPSFVFEIIISFEQLQFIAIVPIQESMFNRWISGCSPREGYTTESLAFITSSLPFCSIFLTLSLYIPFTHSLVFVVRYPFLRLSERRQISK